MGVRCTADLYPRPWAGVVACCCESCGRYFRRYGYVLFFSVSVCGLGMEWFGINPGSSVIIGVLTGLWTAENWCLSM